MRPTNLNQKGRVSRSARKHSLGFTEAQQERIHQQDYRGREPSPNTFPGAALESGTDPLMCPVPGPPERQIGWPSDELSEGSAFFRSSTQRRDPLE